SRRAGARRARRAVASPPRCCAASAASSPRSRSPCAAAACPSRSWDSAASSRRRRSSTSSRSSRPCTIPRAATRSCGSSPGRVSTSARRTCTRSGAAPPTSRDTRARSGPVDVTRPRTATGPSSSRATWPTTGRSSTRSTTCPRRGARSRPLRARRGLTYLSLPELVVEAERALGLDVEAVTNEALLASRRLADPEAVSDRAREHLDAFRDVAAAFSQTADVVTLGAFLAWLGVASTRENGLDLPVREPDPDAVQVITAHAAKGLEWDVVVVPGLVDGVFPTTARSSSGVRADSGWLTDVSQLPYPLRGHAADLPASRYDVASDTKELVARRDEFRAACGEHQLAEERRLAYVAFTRARRELYLTASWWQTGSRPRVLSPFLLELVEAGVVAADGWSAPPGPDDTNPLEDVEVTGTWPAPDDVPAGSARALLRRTAAAVERAA